LLALVGDDEQSPLRGRGSADVGCADGRVHLVNDPAVGESFAEILAVRAGLCATPLPRPSGDRRPPQLRSHGRDPHNEHTTGAGVDRVDGARKVTGAAPYPNDFSFENLALL
jgi:hypothetical protein